MNGLYYFENLINEIEASLTQDIDISALAAKANMSVYEFRRIFTFVAKIPVGEYIRKRRLSCAALDLINGHVGITDIAVKYGYDTPSSFSRAFKEYHGVSPAAVRNGISQVKMLSKISVDIVVDGGNDISYTVIEDTDFEVCGICEESPLSDTECCEDAWESFNNSDIGDKIYSLKNDSIYAVYTSSCRSVDCCIGLRNTNLGTGRVHIPAACWAVFKMNTTEDMAVNGFYKEILARWLENSGYERNTALPNIEVFPTDMENDGFTWEIRVPVIYKGESRI